MNLHMDRRFHKLTLEQVQTLDQVLTEVIPIHGRGNFPTLEVRPKDIIHVVKDRLVEREIRVRDIRLNGSTASHVMVRDNGAGYRDLDIIFGVELPRQEDFQVIKEVVLGSLRDLLPRGVNRRKITCLTMKEAYVQKMVKVFNEHDRWSLISLSNNRGKTVGLRFVSSLRRQFEFSVDSFQIILDHILESYWETEKRQGAQCEGLELHNDNVSNQDRAEVKTVKEPQHPTISSKVKEDKDKGSLTSLFTESPCHIKEVIVKEEHPIEVHATGKNEAQEMLELENAGLDLGSLNAGLDLGSLNAGLDLGSLNAGLDLGSLNAGLDLGSLEDEEEEEVVEDVHLEEVTVLELKVKEKRQSVKDTEFHTVSTPKTLTEVMEPVARNVSVNPKSNTEELLISESEDVRPPAILLTENLALQEEAQLQVTPQSTAEASTSGTQNSHPEHASPPPAKKTCHISQDMVPDYCPSPKPPRKLSKKMRSTSSLPENWSLLKDLSDLTTHLFEPIEIPQTTQLKPPLLDKVQNHYSASSGTKPKHPEGTNTFTDPRSLLAISPQNKNISPHAIEQIVRVKYSKKPPDSEARQDSMPLLTAVDRVIQSESAALEPGPAETTTDRPGSGLGLGLGPGPGPGPGQGPGPGPGACSLPREKASITVVAECMYGDFEQAMDHLRFRLIATHNPEKIRGGGLLKYSDLLVRNFRPASETEIKSLERYMCSRFFIDFPDVSEQQRKIEAYLQGHFIGDEETSKYDYLMTLRRVIDESTVCLMGHERRQTLNMITVLALRVLGEQNAIPNTAHVTCFYQPAPYMADPIFSSYYIPQNQPPLLYHPYPLHVHMQTGLV